MEQIIKISQFILNSFIQIWPYLLVTIPLAVAVQLTGASKFINKALSKNVFLSIFLATVVGAFSPFCSCGVIPLVTSLLIGGVPLAPVMSFWIASPSMDPEIFFLSTAIIGWKLSVWRMVATFVISLSAGYITYIAVKRGFLGSEILRTKKAASEITGTSVHPDNSCKSEACVQTERSLPLPKKVVKETISASLMVAKFMTLAFFINALITFYVPQDLISSFLGGESSLTVFVAALVGIPFYASNMTALPLVSGMISLGMNPGAALAFLIAGPVTTLPAMSAVWGIVKARVFLLYLMFSLSGSILFGLLYNFVQMF